MGAEGAAALAVNGDGGSAAGAGAGSEDGGKSREEGLERAGWAEAGGQVVGWAKGKGEGDEAGGGWTKGPSRAVMEGLRRGAILPSDAFGCRGSHSGGEGAGTAGTGAGAGAMGGLDARQVSLALRRATQVARGLVRLGLRVEATAGGQAGEDCVPS